jgi:hypothetical protein
MTTPYLKIAERFLAHAALCRRMAASAKDESTACKLLEMAKKCVDAAVEELALARVMAAAPGPSVSKWNFSSSQIPDFVHELPPQIS